MRVSGINKSFPGVKALDNVNFAVRKGTVHALCGENGAGKSTLMKIINGIYKADSGQIFLDEKPVTIKDPIQARDYGIAMIAQELNYVPEMSIEENLFLGRLPVTKFGNVDWKRVRRETIEFLRQENLPYKPDQKLKTLTVSDIQMLEIIKAISNNAQIVIMDEPTKGVDVGAKAEIYAIMGDLAKKGYAIILISSEMPEILGMADRIIVMCNGRKTGELDRNEATQERILELAMEKSQNAGEGAAK